MPRVIQPVSWLAGSYWVISLSFVAKVVTDLDENLL